MIMIQTLVFLSVWTGTLSHCIVKVQGLGFSVCDDVSWGVARFGLLGYHSENRGTRKKKKRQNQLSLR